MSTTSTHETRLTQLLDSLRAAGEGRIRAEEDLVALERDYALWQRDTTIALIGTENVLTNKPHSLTSAGEAIKGTEDYTRWTVQLDAARIGQLRARVDYEVALEACRTARMIALLDRPVLDGVS